MTRSGEGREIEAALVGAGCTVREADDLGESKWDIAEAQSSAFAHTACEDDEDEHPTFYCRICGGRVVWQLGDGPKVTDGGYRCTGECGSPYNEDGTLYEGER